MISDYVANWATSPFGKLTDAPWVITQQAEALVHFAISSLGDDYRVVDGIAVHHSTTIEDGAIIKGPAIIGPDCFISASAYLRGGIFLERNCIIGPAAELKTSFMFAGSKLAHLNFVGDSILGSGVNVEAGAMIANYRNEKADKQIRILLDGLVIETGVDKFGVLAGDETRIGANAVIAPGAILAKDSRVGRLHLVDQSPG